MIIRASLGALRACAYCIVRGSEFIAAALVLLHAHLRRRGGPIASDHYNPDTAFGLRLIGPRPSHAPGAVRFFVRQTGRIALFSDGQDVKNRAIRFGRRLHDYASTSPGRATDYRYKSNCRTLGLDDERAGACGNGSRTGSNGWRCAGRRARLWQGFCAGFGWGGYHRCCHRRRTRQQSRCCRNAGSGEGGGGWGLSSQRRRLSWCRRGIEERFHLLPRISLADHKNQTCDQELERHAASKRV